MAQDTAQIRKVQDKEGTQFFPITHVDAVIDENGDAVSTLLAGKQATLVSGTNIKTINNESLLGSGNISVSGGGGGTVTSVAMTVPTGLSISGSPITSSGTLAISLATGYSIPTTSKQDSWDAKGTYSKPSGGIPATDLASAVQTSLGKADTALQSYTESDPVFTASAAAGIATTDISTWNAKLSGVTFNGAAATVTGGVAAITATIPAAPGTLQTNLTTAQTASASEALSGSIKLHKIAKTGTYSDLIGTPTIPTKVSDLTNDAGYTTNTGTVTRVDVGTSQYSPTSGIVSLPAYPTTLPASDVSAWAKESTKPSYTLDEVSDGSTRKLSNYLPLSAGSGNSLTGDLYLGSGKNIESGGDINVSDGKSIRLGKGMNAIYLTQSAINWHNASNTWVSSLIGFESANIKLQQTTTHSGGHIYLTGSNASSSTGNTTQIVFGTSTTNHVALSANSNLLIVNPSTTSSTGQAAIGVNGANTYFSSSGNFGIGTNSPSNKLHVVGTSRFDISSLTDFKVRSTDAYGSSGVTFYPANQTTEYWSAGVNPNDTTYPHIAYRYFWRYKTTYNGYLTTGGNMVITGTYTPGSDMRIKDKQEVISKEQAFSVLEDLKPKTWVWNEKAGEDKHGKTCAGLVAQEVEEILPDAVVVSECGAFKDFHSLNYNMVQGYEIAAIKGLIEEVKSLKAEIAELKKQIK